MRKFFEKIKEVKKIQNNISGKEIGRFKCFKAFLGSVLLSLIALFPLALIYLEIFKIFSPVLAVYHITIVFVCLTVYMFVPFTNMLYYAILKNYTEKEEIHQLSLKYVFISELLNPFYLIISILFVLAIRYFVG